MNKLKSFKSICIPIAVNNIDTDQIIPSRYLKAIDKESVKEGLFADWRYHPDGSIDETFILNQHEYKHAQILLVGDNFGCGSSREHAPWAITGWGIKAVISTSFGDIFKNNALKNGLLPIQLSSDILQNLFDMVTKSPTTEVEIDLELKLVKLPNGDAFGFEIDPFARKCLLSGVDQLGYILSFEDKISQYENKHEIPLKL